MNHFEIVNRLCRIHNLIQQENTGTPDEFAERICISRSQLYNCLGELRDYGALIKYSRKQRTFFYINNFKITIDKLNLSRDSMES